MGSLQSVYLHNEHGTRETRAQIRALPGIAVDFPAFPKQRSDQAQAFPHPTKF